MQDSELMNVLMSDWGWMIAIIVGIAALAISVGVYLTARGFGVNAKERSGSWKRHFSGPAVPAVALLLLGVALAAATLGAFSFYNEIITGPPYIATDIGNFTLIGGVMILLVSIFTLALALMKSFGALGWSKRTGG